MNNCQDRPIKPGYLGHSGAAHWCRSQNATWIPAFAIFKSMSDSDFAASTNFKLMKTRPDGLMGAIHGILTS